MRTDGRGGGGRAQTRPGSQRSAKPAIACRRRRSSRGAALLSVLWLTAALTAIAFSVANTVRGEIERSSTGVDAVRSYYLATGAIDRSILYMLWGPNEKNQDGSARYWAQGMPRLYHRFPTGDAIVEVIPATAKLNINVASEQEILSLLRALGVEEGRARLITEAIVDWRRPVGGLSMFDQQYLAGSPSFRSRHASFQEIEEVLLVQGMTPELFYGTYARREEDGALIRRSGLKDCITAYGANGAFEVNAADPALLLSVGVSPPAVEQIVQRRQRAPIRREDLDQIRGMAGPGGGKLTTGGNSIFTLRATARLRRQDGTLSDLRRSVAAQVKFLGYGFKPAYQVIRWYDRAPSGDLVWP